LLERLDQAEKACSPSAQMGKSSRRSERRWQRNTSTPARTRKHTRGITREETTLEHLRHHRRKDKLLKSVQGQIKAIDKHLSDIEKQKKQHRNDKKLCNSV